MRCWYIRFRLTSLEGKEANGSLQSHLSACENCSLYREKLQALDSGLHRQRALAPAPTIRDTNRAPWLLASGAGIAVAATVLFFVQTRSSTKTQTQLVSQEVERTVHSEMVSSKVPLSLSSTSMSGHLSVLYESSPLEDELNAWRSDGARGLHHLLSLGQNK